MLLVHGFAEHSGRYEHLGAWFAERDVAVHAYDQRGHGRSGGARGFVRRFGELLDDVEQMLARVRSEHRDLPLFLLGHSMGGLVVASFVCERSPDLHGAVTSGAALRVPKPVGRLQLTALRALRSVAPRTAIPNPVDPDALSTDPEVGAAYLADPLVHRRLTASLAVGMFDAMRSAEARASRVRLPMLLLHGSDDALCCASGSRDFAAMVPEARFRLYEGMRHEIFNEPQHASVFEDVLDWMKQRSAPAAEPGERHS